MNQVLRTACGACMDDGGDVRQAGKRYHQRSRRFEATTAHLELMATRGYALLRLRKQVGWSGMNHWSLDWKNATESGYEADVDEYGFFLPRGCAGWVYTGILSVVVAKCVAACIAWESLVSGLESGLSQCVLMRIGRNARASIGTWTGVIPIQREVTERKAYKEHRVSYCLFRFEAHMESKIASSK